MSFDQALGFSFSQNGGNATQFATSASGDGETNLDTIIASGASAASVICPVATSGLLSVVMWSNVSAMSVAFKDAGGSTLQTLNFNANQPLVWASGYPTACPLSGAIETLSVTNSASSSGRLRGFFLQNF